MPEPLRVCTTVGWWPLEFRLDGASRAMATWFRHHLHTVAAPGGDLAPRRPVELTLLADPGLTDKLTDAVTAADQSTVEGYVGEHWTVADTWRGRAWCHGSPPDADPGRHVIVASGVDRWLV